MQARAVDNSLDYFALNIFCVKSENTTYLLAFLAHILRNGEILLTEVKLMHKVAESVVRARTSRYTLNATPPRTWGRLSYMEDYLKWKRATTKNPATTKMYEMWVKRFLKFLEGEPITLNRVMLFRAYLATFDYAPKNIQYGLTLIRDYISYQMTMHNLDFPLKLLKIPQERSKSHHAITIEEYEKMLEVVPKNHPITLQRRLMLCLLWDTGMRGGELLRLRISDIKGRSAVIQTEKNSRNRLVGWTEETDRVLRFYLPLRQQLETKSDFLFVSFHFKPRKPLSTRQLEVIFKDIARKAGLGLDIRPHGMRHGFTHQQLQKRTPITTIAQMLGHSTVFNVLAYSQLASKEIEEAWGL